MYRLAVALTLVVALLPSAALAEPQFELHGNELVVPYPVTFEQAALTADAAKAIDYVKQYLDAKSYISMMRIEVHTDAQGDQAYNQKLSEKRALAVAAALVASGVDCKRVIPVGFGESKPIGDNKTASGRAVNRRTVFANAALRGKAIGGAALDGGGRVAGDPCAK